MVSENEAAWLQAKKERPLVVKEAPRTPPGATELVIKNAAVAINPVDTAKQILGNVLLGYIQYPFVLGGDLAGEVVEIGSEVTRFKTGDRALAHAVGMASYSNKASEGAFQRYTVVREDLAAVIPDSISYEQACVLPLCLSTASYGLFHKDFLALEPPTVPPSPKGKAIIITSGSSSVGSNAIQLAVAAGYEVYTTASTQNFDYVRRLGARDVFDYHKSSYEDDMIAALKDKVVVGALAINNGSLEACTKVLSRCDGVKFIASAGPPWPQELPKTSLGLASLMASIVWWTGSTAIKSMVNGVRSKFIDGNDMAQVDNVVSKYVYRDFLPQALAKGQFVPAPPPLVIGQGLESIQEAFDVLAKGVSAKKVVVSI